MTAWGLDYIVITSVDRDDVPDQVLTSGRQEPKKYYEFERFVLCFCYYLDDCSQPILAAFSFLCVCGYTSFHSYLYMAVLFTLGGGTLC